MQFSSRFLIYILSHGESHSSAHELVTVLIEQNRCKVVWKKQRVLLTVYCVFQKKKRRKSRTKLNNFTNFKKSVYVVIAILMFRYINFKSLEAAVCRRSSKWVFLKVSPNLQQNICVESLFNRDAGLQACKFIKKRLQHRYFPVNIAKFLRRPFVAKHLRWLLLHHPDGYCLLCFL